MWLDFSLSADGGFLGEGGVVKAQSASSHLYRSSKVNKIFCCFSREKQHYRISVQYRKKARIKNEESFLLKAFPWAGEKEITLLCSTWRISNGRFNNGRSPKEIHKLDECLRYN